MTTPRVSTRINRIPANTLLDELIKLTQVSNDASLCNKLNVAPPMLSKIRHNRVPVTSAFILNVHETLHVPVAQIRRWMTAA